MSGVIDSKDPSSSGTMGAVGAGLSILGVIPVVGFIFGIVGYVLQLIAIKRLADYVKKPDIFWGFIVSLITAIFAGFTGALVFGLSLFAGRMTDSFETIGIGGVIGILVTVGLLVYGAIRQFKSLSALSESYGVSYFKYAAWLYIVGLATLILGVGFLLIIVYMVMMILGFLALRNGALPK